MVVKKELKNFQNTDGDQLTAPNRDCFSKICSLLSKNKISFHNELLQSREEHGNSFRWNKSWLDSGFNVTWGTNPRRDKRKDGLKFAFQFTRGAEKILR
jgi:hypothetical protein